MADDTEIRDLALRALDAGAQVDELTGSRDDEYSRPSFNVLYQHIMGKGADRALDIQSLLSRHPEMARDFEHLLKNIAYAEMPVLVAAAGDAIRRREHGSYVLQLSNSEVEPEQVYLGIETGLDLIDQPRQLYVKTADGTWHELAIPPMINGRAQWALEKASPVVDAFEQPNTVIYIR